MPPLQAASIVLLVGPVLALAGSGVYALANRQRATGLTPRIALARAGSYAALALVLVAAAWLGVVGLAVLFAVLGSLALVEWSRLFDLPVHHSVAVVVANGLIIGAVAITGAEAADWLVGGLVLVGATWPVIRADTGRAIRDLGMAIVGVVLTSVMLAHGVALAVEHGDAGMALVLALAVGCAFADVGALVVGRRYG